ncbi:Type I restriction-modification system, specificity subunit S [Lacticaseibacillus paracasei subsp. paracasei Lpp226]|uniref:restriction endonuclease subunit S n=1 Tax=Lacticaseibacillus paracasei TaxID=1597 RepID=UPI0003433C5A|nr:restriction endonuclease subunit S [Lacticaseibacillus paracasei]EPC22408.1 Type I restriction-modification system, specificity subunit S [Lacticaseibacillus paracasei subsp. paracasei Lpp226]
MSKDAKNVPALRFKGYSDAWEKRKLTELSKNKIGGGTPSTKVLDFWNGKLPWLQSSDINESNNYSVKPQKFISLQALKHSAAKRVPANSIAVVTRVGVGKLALIEYDYSTSQDFLSFSSLNWSALFSVNLLTLIMTQMSRESQGTSIKGVTKSELLAKKVRIPISLKEQEKLGILMKSINDLIAATQDKIDALEQAKKALLQRLFDQSWRFKGYSDPWEKRKLNYFLHVNEIKNKSEIYSKKDVLSVSGEFGIVNQIELQGRSFAGSSVKNYGVVELGDVVYTKSPLKKNPFGIVKVNRNKAGIVSTLYAIYKPQTTLYSPIIDYYFQSDCRVNNYLKPLVNKGAKNDMKVKNVDVLKGNVTIPSEIDEQRTIVGLLNKLDKLIAATQSRLSSLELLKKYLLQDLFI